MVCVGLHVQFLVTVGYVAQPTPLPPLFLGGGACLLPKIGIVNTQSFFLCLDLKYYFVSPGWNKGLNLNDWVYPIAGMPGI
jgi:hypothetical protein